MTVERTKDAPRRQHYYFAHIYLRDRAFSHPKLLIDELFKDDSAQYLKIRWAITGFESKAEEDDFISADGLEAFPIKIGNDYYGALIQLPTPERMAEAYFVAIVLPADADASTSCDFYTLEFSKWDDGSDKTVLGKWAGEGAHYNLGSGPEPEKQAFIDVIHERIYNRPKIGKIRI